MTAPTIITTEDPMSKLDNESTVALGQWYWVRHTPRQTANVDEDEEDGQEWLGCIVHVGSNFVSLKSPPNDGSSWAKRVHFDHFWSMLRAEPNPEQVIRERVDAAQTQIAETMDKIRELTTRLGVVPQTQIAQEGEGGGLAVISSHVDAKAYELSLLQAKKTDLPALFKEMEKGHKNLVSWMSAQALPAKAMADSMKGVIDTIEDRLFTVSLYAGLIEEAVACCEGDPADMGEPLHIMQRRLYMDEECLLSYVPGGININTVEEFDRWISVPENRDRLLPFPRTLAAFRVRRREAHYEDGGNLLRAFINIQIAQADKSTFLYVRNGDQVWRIDCKFTFDEMIFPTETGLGNEPMMINKSWSSDIKLMPTREYEARLAQWTETTRLHKEWNDAHPEENEFNNPHRVSVSSNFHPSKFEPFDMASVYHDDAYAKIAAEMKQHNRLAVIVQGLFDRSLVLHPHPPVKMWEQHSFERAVTLVRDGEALSDGAEAPDFEAYRRRLNASLGVGSIVTGQEDVWKQREAVKENERQRRDYRNKNPSHYKRYTPYGNPGPGVLATVAAWKPRSRKATFQWTKEAGWRSTRDVIPCSMDVSADSLLNVSAYTPGDFKQFYADHRMREQYLAWAPLMLAAEDYHAGKLSLGSRP